MTNALRGFNMEINETNAQRIADVYSKLAAMSASNVDEISTAMTKVASLASNANMSFEKTAAFLS
jgi:TP901 family phage tail tape measure protein